MTQTNFSEKCLKPSDLDTTKGFKKNKKTGLWEVDAVGDREIYPLVSVDNKIEILGGKVIRNYMTVRNGQGWLHFDFIPPRKWWKGRKTNTPIFTFPDNAPQIMGLVESNITMTTNVGGIKISQVWTADSWKAGNIFMNSFSGTLSGTKNERRININIPCMVKV